MYPLAILPASSDNLETMDSRASLRHLNTFMKNALIRGLNSIHRVSFLIQSDHPEFGAFMGYAQLVCDMIALHIEGDEVFFTTRNHQGIELELMMSKFCYNPSTSKLQDSVKRFRQKLYHWKEFPQTYSSPLLRESLTFGEEMLTVMQKQLSNMKSDVLESIISNEDLRIMIKDHMEWLVSHVDISILLPFVMSHHDPLTSAYWPAITDEGLAAMPELVEKHSACWLFAPFHPISGEIKLWSC